MALSDDILMVRKNTNEPTEATYDDAAVTALLATMTVVGASAQVWEWKAAYYSDLVNTQEAGSNEALGDLYKHALDMAKLYRARATEELYPAPEPILSPIVSVIERSS